MSQFFNSKEKIDQSKHHLPHWHQKNTWVFVTWRLADSLPQEKLKQLKQERQDWKKQNTEPLTPEQKKQYLSLFEARVEQWLDQGSGTCLLQKFSFAKIVAEAIKHFHEKRYRLSSFVVMPNHVHVLFQPYEGHQLKRIVQLWKGYSARKINELRQQSGALWQAAYWDRLIRSPAHFKKVKRYIQENPQKAKLSKGNYWLEEFD